jgi:hypothetical protein
MEDLKSAIERGDLDAFVALCAKAIEAGDGETIELGLATLARLPAGVAEPLKRKVREAFPDLVAGLPSFLGGAPGEPLPPSTPLNALLQRAIECDRDGARADIRAGKLPTVAGGRRLADAIVSRVPARADLPRPLLVDRGENLIVTAPGERGTFVVFTGLGERVWLDLPVFDAWLADAGYGGIYLRDPSRRLYTEGTPDHDGAEAFAAFLRGCRDATRGEFAFLGASSGGFGAMYWACALGVRRTLAFSSATSTTRARLEAIGDDRVLMLQRLLMPAGGGPDLRERMLATGFDGRVDVHYGADAKFDRLHAEYLDLPNVRRHPLPGWSHHPTLPPLAAAGRLPAILRGEA